MTQTTPPPAGPDFRSDNVGAAAPEIIAALARANTDTATGYGGDTWSQTLQARFSDLFEAKVTVFAVATGTAANALSMVSVSQSTRVRSSVCWAPTEPAKAPASAWPAAWSPPLRAAFC